MRELYFETSSLQFFLEIDLGNNVTLYISKGAYVLGSGKFGKVILADLKEEGSEPKKVAVKMLKGIRYE